MGLWKRIRQWLPLAALATTFFFLLRMPPAVFVDPARTAEEAQREDRRRKLLVLLTGTALSAGALAGAYAIRRARRNGVSVLQPAVEHPFIASAVAGLSYGVSNYLQFPAVIPSVNLGLFAGLASYLATYSLSKVKPPYLSNYARTMREVVRGITARDLEKRQHALEQMRAYVAHPEQVDIELTDVLFLQNRVDDALDLLKKTVAQADTATDPLFRRVGLPLLSAATAVFRSREYLSRSFISLRDGDSGGAMDMLDAFVAEQPGPARFAARAHIIQTWCDLWPSLSRHLPARSSAATLTDLEQRAQRAWHDTIDVILNDPQREARFKPMGESRNEVLECDVNPFIKELTVFKRCDLADRVRLRNEREDMLEKRKRFGKHIAQSLAYTEHEGKAYHVLLHATDHTLEDMLNEANKEDRLRAWTQAADLLAQFHTYPATYASPEIAQDHYAKRLKEVFYDQLKQHPLIDVPEGIRPELGTVGTRIFRELAAAPQGWYKDANARNWLVEPWHVLAIDFEHRILLPVQLDLVSLLEGPVKKKVAYTDEAGVKHEHVTLELAEEDERMPVREHYFRTLAKAVRVDRQAFWHQYPFAALQRHLELSGYRARDDEVNAVAFHLDQARSYALALGEHGLAEHLRKIVIRGGGASAAH